MKRKRRTRPCRAEETPELTMTVETREFLHEGMVVLTAEYGVPSAGGLAPPVTARLNRYCGALVRECARYAEKTLYPLAARTHAAALEEGRLLPPFRLCLRCAADPPDREKSLTLRTELTEQLHGETVTLRREDTFSLRDGWPLL